VKGLLFALLSLSSLVVAQSPKIPTDRPLILTRVAVIDATGPLAKPDMRVVIRDHKITAIDRTSAIVPPKDGEIVDATGKFLIPGLWDMHVQRMHRVLRFPDERARYSRRLQRPRTNGQAFRKALSASPELLPTNSSVPSTTICGV
jgi:imidazolonepropionase-like amidohydrolase